MIAVGFVVAMVLIGAAASAGPPAEQVTYRGEFLGRRVAIGGETTGWAMRYHAPDGDKIIELDVKREVANRFKEGDRVRVTGTLTEREYVERGTVRVLVVTEMTLDRE